MAYVHNSMWKATLYEELLTPSSVVVGHRPCALIGLRPSCGIESTS